MTKQQTIHKNTALDYVEVCSNCYGRGWDIVKPIQGDKNSFCKPCSGKGIVLKEAK